MTNSTPETSSDESIYSSKKWDTIWENPEINVVVGFDVRGSSQLASEINATLVQVYELIHSTIVEAALSVNLSFRALHLQGDGGFLFTNMDSLEVALQFAETLTLSGNSTLDSRFAVGISLGEVTHGSTRFDGSEHSVFAGNPVTAVANVLKTLTGNQIAIDHEILHDSLGASVVRVVQGREFVCYRNPSRSNFLTFSDPVGNSPIPNPQMDERFGYQVHLVPPFLDWPNNLGDVLPMLRHTLGVSSSEVELIGSAGLRGVWGKPILDVMVKVNSKRLEESITLLEELGMILVHIDELPERKLMRRRNSSGEPELHVHLVSQREWDSSRERKFRHLLETNSEVASCYSAAKRLVHLVTKGDPRAYGMMKRSFILWLEEVRNYEIEHSS